MGQRFAFQNGVECLVYLQHIYHLFGLQAQQTRHILHLRRLAHHSVRHQLEVEAENDGEHHRRQLLFGVDRQIVVLEGQRHIHAAVEGFAEAEARHLPEPLHVACKSAWVFGVCVPETLQRRRGVLFECHHLLLQRLRRNMQLERQIDHGARVFRLNACRTLLVELHDKQPVVVCPKRMNCHILY